MTVFLACRNDSFPCLPQGSRACRETRPLSSRAQPRDLSRTPCGLCAVSQQYGLHMTNTRTRSDPFEGARSFTLLARGKTSAPQSAAYGRKPMAICCRKRQLFCRRLLRGGFAAAPLRVTPRDFSFNNFLRVRKPRFFVGAVGCVLTLPQGAKLACALPVLLFPKISLCCDFREPCCRILATFPKRGERAPSNNFLQKQKSHFLLLPIAPHGRCDGRG